MTGGGRIADLPDHLLGRILYFAPAKEAASTSALARRWHTLWLSSGAVNIDSRSHAEFQPRFSHERDGGAVFRRRATAALGAAHAGRSHVRKLTFHAESEQVFGLTRFLLHRQDGDLVDVLLSHPVARRVEELRVGAHVKERRVCAPPPPTDRRRDVVVHEAQSVGGFFTVRVGSMPSEALRVLHISGCRELLESPAPGTASFLRLEILQLQLCRVALKGLQTILDAAPRLATLQLDSLFLCLSKHDGAPTAPRPRLRCRAVTDLVMLDCGWQIEEGYEHIGVAVELDAPILRRFRYKGFVRQFSLVSPVPDLTRVDLHLGVPHRDRKNRVEPWQHFGQFVHNFSNTKVLKLIVNYLEDIAITSDKSKVELLGANNMLFSNLEHLELDALHKPGCDAAGETIAKFLRCCPAIRVLRLNLSAVEEGRYEYIGDIGYPFLQKKKQQDFQRSVDCFSRRKIKLTDPSIEVSDIPGLSGHSFECLQSSLRSVSLQFRRTSLKFRRRLYLEQLETANCFGVQLAKFFAENSLVLEEMHVDNGNQQMYEHINHKVGVWVANSSERRNMARAPAGFAVLPIESSR